MTQEDALHGPSIEHRCADLDEFWEAISPVGELFGAATARFVYRGQRDARWSLVPSVYRRGILQRYKLGIAAILKDHPEQCFFEWTLLKGFVSHCDTLGLAVPGDSMDFRTAFTQDRVGSLIGINSENWPPDFMLPLMAAAQHHGIPTRLLDWSSRSYAAAYFAAAGVVAKPDELDGDLAVFGLDVNHLTLVPGLAYRRVPGSTSANLSAQAGSFILVNNAGYRGEPFVEDVSVESKLPAHFSGLHMVTLPKRFAVDLYDRCAKFGICRATLFPGYSGCAETVLEDWLAVGAREVLQRGAAAS
jgi:hypothetical protein